MLWLWCYLPQTLFLLFWFIPLVNSDNMRLAVNTVAKETMGLKPLFLLTLVNFMPNFLKVKDKTILYFLTTTTNTENVSWRKYLTLSIILNIHQCSSLWSFRCKEVYYVTVLCAQLHKMGIDLDYNKILISAQLDFLSYKLFFLAILCYLILHCNTNYSIIVLHLDLKEINKQEFHTDGKGMKKLNFQALSISLMKIMWALKWTIMTNVVNLEPIKSIYERINKYIISPLKYESISGKKMWISHNFGKISSKVLS